MKDIERVRESTRVIAGTELTGLFWIRFGGGDLEEEEVLILAEIQLGFLLLAGERAEDAEEVRLKLLTNEAEDMVAKELLNCLALYTSPLNPSYIQIVK